MCITICVSGDVFELVGLMLVVSVEVLEAYYLMLDSMVVLVLILLA